MGCHLMLPCEGQFGLFLINNFINEVLFKINYHWYFLLNQSPNIFPVSRLFSNQNHNKYKEKILFFFFFYYQVSSLYSVMQRSIFNKIFLIYPLLYQFSIGHIVYNLIFQIIEILINQNNIRIITSRM